MSTTPRLTLILMTVFSVAFGAWGADSGIESEAAMKLGAPDWQSAGELAFGPGGVLFAADSMGTAVFAIDLDDQDPAASAEDLRIQGIDNQIASLLGTTPREILIHDMAVHPTSHNIYLAVSRGRGDDAKPVLLKIRPPGELSEVSLLQVRFGKAAIKNAPDAEAKTRRGTLKRTLTITDLAYADGYVYVAGLSNEEFASNLRQIPYPFTGEMSATSVEIFHGAHGRYETQAPIRTMLPYKLHDKPHLLAAYTCTPLVTLPVEKLTDGVHLKGKTVAELGFGNSPLDMISYEREGERYILITNSNRAGMKLKAQDIEKAGAITEEVEGVSAGAGYVSTPMAGVLHLSDFDDQHIVMMRRDLMDGSLSLRTLSKRRL